MVITPLLINLLTPVLPQGSVLASLVVYIIQHTTRNNGTLLNNDLLSNEEEECVTWWHIGGFDVFRPKDREFESRSSRHVRILNKSFTRSCLWRLGVKLRHSIRAVSGAPLSSSLLE